MLLNPVYKNTQKKGGGKAYFNFRKSWNENYMKKNIKLKTSLFLLFLICTVIPLLALGIFFTSYYNDKLMKILENDLSVAAQMQVESIQNFLEEREITISIVTGYEAVQRLVKATNDRWEESYFEDQKTVNAVLSTFISKNRYLVSASIINKEFQVLASSVKIEDGTISKLKNVDPKYLDGEIHFSPVFTTETGGEQEKVVVIIKGIYQEEELLGYFVEEMNLDFFEKVRISVNLFNNGTIYLMDGKGTVISAGNASDTRKDYITTPEERTDYERAWAERDPLAAQGILRYRIKDHRYLSYYSGFENLDWKLITSVNVDEILQVPTERVLLLFVAAGLFTAVVIVNRLLTAHITKPLEAMIEKFREIKETTDYSIRIEQGKNSEISMISMEINDLLANVEEHMKLEQQKQHRLHEAASTDSLTGLYNKRAMEEILGSAMDKLSLQKGQLAIIYLDVDNFKSFNTDYGHSGGDKVLVFIAKILKEFFPMSCRIGGDEFVACVAEEQEIQTIDMTLKLLFEQFQLGVKLDNTGRRVSVCCSAGVAFWSKEEGYDSLLDKADKAMYQIKNSTKNDFFVQH